MHLHKGRCQFLILKRVKLNTLIDIYRHKRRCDSNLAGAKNISDDILIFGRTQKEPDNTLNDTLKALTASGLKLSQSKCEFNRDHITFFGLLFRKSGISPDPTKVSAILESKSPANACELRIVLLFKVHT